MRVYVYVRRGNRNFVPTKMMIAVLMLASIRTDEYKGLR